MLRCLLAAFLLVPLALMACGDGPDEVGGSASGGCTTGTGVSRATFNNEKATTTGSGLMFCDEKIGSSSGSPSASSSVTVHYTGYLADDGTQFESTRNNQPASFSMNGVIPGFSEALSSMKSGGRRLVLIPADLAYGARGQGPVPPNADLIFDLELVSFR